ncbi:MAG: hypothetical protein ACKOED_11270 [Aestuariivirga sp.]|uniref:hypothetical protein n=1 Tax=Aestuariivirga sp. TaxID=2650926 RepID=UPI0038D07D69
MTLKSLIAAASVALGLAIALPAADARADVDVDIGFGVITGGYGYGYHPGWDYGGYRPYRPRPYLYDYEDAWADDAFVSCRQGRKILRNYGFRDIKTENCRAPHYEYIGWKKGREFLIRMNTRGEINRVSRIH